MIRPAAVEVSSGPAARVDNNCDNNNRPVRGRIVTVKERNEMQGAKQGKAPIGRKAERDEGRCCC